MPKDCAIYWFTHESAWSLRFLLPAFPPLLVAALLVVARLAGRRAFAQIRRLAWIAWAGGLALVASAFGWNVGMRTDDRRRSQREYAQTSAWARESGLATEDIGRGNGQAWQ